MRGKTTINLTFEISFTKDGQSLGMLAIRAGDEGGEHVIDVTKESDIWEALPEALRDQIEADAWDDAEPDSDEPSLPDGWSSREEIADERTAADWKGHAE